MPGISPWPRSRGSPLGVIPAQAGSQFFLCASRAGFRLSPVMSRLSNTNDLDLQTPLSAHFDAKGFSSGLTNRFGDPPKSKAANWRGGGLAKENSDQDCNASSYTRAHRPSQITSADENEGGQESSLLPDTVAASDPVFSPGHPSDRLTVQLNESWRVEDSELQWFLQRKKGTRWDSRSNCRT
jgi:hypothetical protein